LQIFNQVHTLNVAFAERNARAQAAQILLHERTTYFLWTKKH